MYSWGNFSRVFYNIFAESVLIFLSRWDSFLRATVRWKMLFSRKKRLIWLDFLLCAHNHLSHAQNGFFASCVSLWCWLSLVGRLQNTPALLANAQEIWWVLLHTQHSFQQDRSQNDIFKKCHCFEKPQALVHLETLICLKLCSTAKQCMKLFALWWVLPLLTVIQLSKESFNCSHHNLLTLIILGYEYVGIQLMIHKVFLLISFPVEFQVWKVWVQALGSLTVSSENSELYY